MATPFLRKTFRAIRFSGGSSMFGIALRNIFRQRARTALTLSSIGAGVAGLILSGGFVTDALNQLRESTIHAQVGHLQIYKAGYFEAGKRSPFQYLIDRPQEILDRVDGLPEVARTMSRLSFAGVLNNGKSDLAILGEGIESQKEALLGTQIQITAGRRLAAGDRFGMMIGEGVASGAGVGPGDTVNLLLNTEDGALNNLEFKVVGVFRTASKDYDARAVRIGLADAQELLASKAVNAVVVELKSTASTDEVAAVLREKLVPLGFEVKTWLQLADYYEKTAALFKQQFAFLQFIILLSVLLSVANSVNMTIFERTGEFGTLLALGTRRFALFRLVVLENILVGLIGSLLGVALAVVAAFVINRLQIEMPPPPNANGGYFAGIQLDFSLILTAFVVGSIATPMTALLPARRISRIAVVDALRMN
jgi:putative ABC transport system permease protein